MAESLVEPNNSENDFIDPRHCNGLGSLLDHEDGNNINSNVRVMLENNPLWDEFHTENTEMIITKAGRRMFPEIRIRVVGLEMDERYILVMDLAPYDDNRYKYHENEWVVAGKADPPVQGRLYIHPDSPCMGREWVKQPISFQKMKLTNNNLDQNGYIILNSMHKYQARVHIVLMDMTDENGVRRPSSFSTHTFKETVFYAVTAYQNPKITKLKIKYNAFAKGFRSSDHALCYQDGTFGPGPPYIGIPDSSCPSHNYNSLSPYPSSSLPPTGQGNGTGTAASDQTHSSRDDFFYNSYPNIMNSSQSYLPPSPQLQPIDPSLYIASSSLHPRH